jgi:hypothetical protein
VVIVISVCFRWSSVIARKVLKLSWVVDVALKWLRYKVCARWGMSLALSLFLFLVSSSLSLLLLSTLFLPLRDSFLPSA